MVKPRKAIALLSGGLDSMLAAALVKSWGFEMMGITFKTPFWGVEKAEKTAQSLDIPLRIIDISDQHFKILKSPLHGFGKNMNPCIDCHILMLKEAKGLMGKNGARFIVTGEVLGERPFSQNKRALSIVEREAGAEGILVRPLSGKLLPRSLPEKKGWIKKEWLLDIQGRQRKKQLELAKKLGIEEFPTPAGGCLLTDPNFSQRLKLLFENFKAPQPEDAELLKHGRVFWEERTLIVVGRNDEENQKLAKLAKSGDVLIKMKDIPGPTALMRGKITLGTEKKAKELVKMHAKKAREKRVEWKIKEIGKALRAGQLRENNFSFIINLMILVNFKTYPEGTGKRAVELAKICQKVGKETKVKIIPVVQVVDLWRVKQAVDIPLFVQHVDLFEPGKHTGWVSLEAVVEAGAVGTLLDHSERPIPPGMVKQILKRVSGKSGKSGISGENFRVVVCAKTLGQAARLVKLKPDFLAYEPPELIGAKQVSVATVHPKTIEKVVKLGQAKSVPVIVGAGIHSAQDVEISLRKGAVGVLVATDVVLAKEPEKELRGLASAF